MTYRTIVALSARWFLSHSEGENPTEKLISAFRSEARISGVRADEDLALLIYIYWTGEEGDVSATEEKIRNLAEQCYPDSRAEEAFVLHTGEAPACDEVPMSRSSGKIPSDLPEKKKESEGKEEGKVAKPEAPAKAERASSKREKATKSEKPAEVRKPVEAEKPAEETKEEGADGVFAALEDRKGKDLSSLFGEEEPTDDKEQEDGETEIDRLLARIDVLKTLTK